MENELEIKIDDGFAKKVYDEIWDKYQKTAQTKAFTKKAIHLPLIEVGDFLLSFC